MKCPECGERIRFEHPSQLWFDSFNHRYYHKVCHQKILGRKALRAQKEREKHLQRTLSEFHRSYD